MTKKKTGVAEWAEHSLNIARGCSNNCRYCYARQMMVERFKLVKAEDWPTMKLNEDVNRLRFGKRSGVTMFPTTHDITPEILHEASKVISLQVVNGNKVMIVTKPRLECIKRLCDTLYTYGTDKIMFRFTIGSASTSVLKFWEPGASGYEEREKSLKYAYSAGFGTSVSCEPYLDLRIGDVVEDLYDFVTDTIWIGKIRHINSRVNWEGVSPEEKARKLAWLTDIYSDVQVLTLYKTMCHLDKIRWKDSIIEVLEKHGIEVKND